MKTLAITIDQTPCRASYGILGQQALRQENAAYQKSAVLEGIATYVNRGDRMAKIAGEENGIAAIMSEQYISEPVPDVVIVPVERPVISVREVANRLDISI